MKREYILFSIFPISQLLILLGGYISIKGNSIRDYSGLILSIIADMVLLYALIHGGRKEKIETERERIAYLYRITSERNNVIENQKKEIYLLRSDYEKHLFEINKSLEKGNKKQVKDRLDKLQLQLNHAISKIYCHNTIVNAVIKEKEQRCEELGCVIDIDLIVPEKMDIEPLYLCSIFSNLLDNAIEAVEELDKAKRSISIKSEIKGNYMFVKVTNTTTKAYATRDVRVGHGYGSKILKDIAKKYDGEYMAKYNKGYYLASIGVKVFS